MEYLYFLLLFGPGLVLAFYCIAADEFDLFERFLLGLGLSLAFYPIVYLIGHVLHLPINGLVIDVLIALSFLALGWRLFQYRHHLSIPTASALKVIPLNQWLAWLFLLIVLALSLYVRVAIVQGLQIPLWSDSYHHTMISQLLMDNQGLFSSWAPYAPLQTFTYHFGFHSLVASYAWLTGVAVPRSVIVVGQMVNFLVVLECYLLAKQVTGNPWAGNFAALFVGLIFTMPAYYVNWGRYTQLTGMALLAVAIVLVVQLLAQPEPGWKSIFMTALAITGLGLAHYGVLVFFILFGLILVAYHLLQARGDRARLKRLALTLLQVSLLTGLLASPWIWNFIQGRFLTIVTTIVTQAPGADAEKILVHNSLGDIRFFFNTHWYILTGMGVFWALWRRAQKVTLISIWSLSLLILANPGYLKLPGTGLINNFAVFISLFLPFSVILAYLIGDVILKAEARATWSLYLAIVGLLALGIWGAKFRLSFFEPKNQLVTDSDLAAMAWVKENIPPEATFLINHTFVYNNSTIIGTDAGWWLPLLAHRQNLILPMSAQEIREPDTFKANKFFRQLDKLDLSNLSGYTFLKDHGITYIYIGGRQGQVWNETHSTVLDAEALKQSGFYQEIYNQDNVVIFAVPGIPPELGETSAN